MPAAFPPGPRDWTLGLSQLRKIKQDVLGYYTELQRRYGDVVCLRLGSYRTYVFFHPDAVREVLVAVAAPDHEPRWQPPAVPPLLARVS